MFLSAHLSAGRKKTPRRGRQRSYLVEPNPSLTDATPETTNKYKSTAHDFRRRRPQRQKLGYVNLRFAQELGRTDVSYL